tara:strand:+ start:65 stop:823 length:759 start_codon:yes stop_codon:yes gene_type:complete
MNLQKEISKIKTKWKDILLQEYETNKKEWKLLETFLNKEIETFSPTLEIFPPVDTIFKAFTYFDPKDTKVIILGQDCYHGRGQAMGLCFSVPTDCKTPPSLKNIFKELKEDECIMEIPTHGDLTSWAKQGVLLLNSSLTVREKCPMSHMKYWKPITDKLIDRISKYCDHQIIFLLWGNASKSKSKFINTHKHIVLQSAHPSPLSANRYLQKGKSIVRDKTNYIYRGWFGCSHFSIVNTLLEKTGQSTITWDT